MRWRLVNLTGDKQTVTKDKLGNTVVSTAPSIAIFSPMHDGPRGCQRYGQQLLVYRTDKGMYACTTGSGAEGNITPMRTQERWEELHSQALAGFIMLGRVPKIEEEII